MRYDIDYRLYLVTDQPADENKSLITAVEEALAGGVTLLQLREKECEAKVFLEEAEVIQALAKKYQVPLIINDRLDIAMACDADGVHVGQNDLPVATVRKMIGKEKIVGASIQTVQEALEAEKAGADYLGVGSMFPTDTKKDAIMVTHEELAAICQSVSLPIVLIGGLNSETIPCFSSVPIQGFAVVSALLASNQIQEASQNLLEIINKTLGIKH